MVGCPDERHGGDRGAGVSGAVHRGVCLDGGVRGVSESSYLNFTTQDELTRVQYQKFILPRLRTGEVAIFVTRWTPLKGIATGAYLVLIFASLTFAYYRSFFTFGSVHASCGDSIVRGCRALYFASLLIVPLGAVSIAVCIQWIVGVFLGWTRQVYAITNQRIISCRMGFPWGFVAFELKALSCRTGWLGLYIDNGKLKTCFLLDAARAEAALACLNDAIQRLRP